MKIFLIFSLWLFSGQVLCEDVTGYTGGSVIINWHYDHLKYMNHTKYFCKIKQNKCINEFISQKWDAKVKFMAVDDIITGLYSVFIRNISKQDAGDYRCGVEGASNIDVILKVKEDPCCGTSLTQTAHQAQNITLNCTYPEEYKDYVKYVFRVANDRIHAVINTFGQPKRRFSLLEETQENVFSLEISDVLVKDGGLYLCGAQKKMHKSMTLYIPVFCEIQLHVTLFPSSPGSSDLSVHIITVCVCVGLLLIGGSALMVYKLGCNKSQGSSFSTNRRNTINSNEVHYEDVSDYTQVTLSTVYATTHKLLTKPTSANSPVEPALDFYAVALLPMATAETSPVYATVHHGV